MILFFFYYIRHVFLLSELIEVMIKGQTNSRKGRAEIATLKAIQE